MGRELQWRADEGFARLPLASKKAEAGELAAADDVAGTRSTIPDGAAEPASFGPFALDSRARLLLKDGQPVPLGARAFDILCVLVRNAGRVVSKRDLLSQVWKDVSVEEDSLRFHVSALRKVLGQGKYDRYVTTLAGQGYCFVAPVSVSRFEPKTETGDQRVAERLPPRLARMVGRDAAVAQVSQRLVEKRFVNLVGPGGIGKTTLALAVGHDIAESFSGDIRFCDLGSLNEGYLVPMAVSTALGLAVQSDNPTADLITFLRDKRMLLVLDCCERVIEHAAAMAERLYQGAHGVHLLATSREAMRVEGEQVILVSPLVSPPHDVAPAAEDLTGFPATQLFLERMFAGGRTIEIGDGDAPFIAEICRNLDGIPLAIELAAGRTSAFGIQGTAAKLNDLFEILHEGRRTALPRHRTLSATLDWSHDLLTDEERVIFRRLSVFVGSFTLEAAQSVIGDDVRQRTGAILASLIAKSLVNADMSRALTRYRLLDTTRAYGARKLVESGEYEGLARRHAEFFASFARRLDFDINRTTDAFSAHGEHLGNIRSALEWSLSRERDVPLGIALAAAAAPFHLELSLLTECRQWCGRATARLDENTRGGQEEMELQAALGLAVMFTESNSDEARLALERGLALAERLHDWPNQLRLVGCLHLFHYRTGGFRTALAFAEQSRVIAERIGDPVGIAAAHSLLGISHHLIDDLTRAYEHLDAAQVLLPASQRINTVHFGVDYRNRAGICMARTLWLLGFPVRAAAVARRTVEEAASLDHPVTLCIALIWAVTVFLWIEDWETAERYIDQLVAHARSRSIIPYPAAGSGVQGYLAVKRGDASSGVPLIESAIRSLQHHRYELLTTPLYSALAEGFLLLGQRDRAVQAVEDALALMERNGDLYNAPELLRIKGDILAAGNPIDIGAAESCYLQSRELAICHGALSWQLRTTVSLARLWSDQGRVDEARRALNEVCARFTEGFESPDLRRAKDLIEPLRGGPETAQGQPLRST